MPISRCLPVSTWLVFNGEIYGYVGLRRELEALGHQFRTQSDTEVVLNAYRQWGDAFIDRLDGMFAIALWDADAQRLKLYRDRPGIKPLYYYFDGRHFAFASELKAIENAVGTASLVVDETALYDFLSYRYVPAPKTLYRNCYKLPPAHTLTFDPHAARLPEPVRFWSIPVGEESLAQTIDEAAEELRALIAAAVRDQMIADVPLGFFLSGGVDSSVVVAAATQGSAQVSTFSIGFDCRRRIGNAACARGRAALWHGSSRTDSDGR